MDAGAGSFLFKAHLVLVLAIGDAEDVPFFIASVHLRDEELVELELFPYLLAV